MDPGASKRVRQHFAEDGEASLGTGNGVGMRFHVVDDQRSLVIRRGPAAGLPHQRFKTQFPAGPGGSLKARKVRVALAEGHSGSGAVEPERRPDLPGLGQAQQFDAEFEVTRRTQRLHLPDNGQRGGCAGRMLHLAKLPHGHSAIPGRRRCVRRH
ncbi:hypothetical protein D9M72_596790 [compost metagenome]